MKILSLAFLLCALIPTIFSKLEMVIEVFRHGAREPIGAPFDYNNWPESQGELTYAGMRQHYLLGREMRKKYIERIGFLSEKFNHSEMYVRSTDVNRTIMSVQSHLLGLYPLGAGPKFPSDYPLERAVPPYVAHYDVADLGYSVLPDKYQPIAVHIVESSKDFLLAPGGACPNYDEIREIQKKSQFFADLNEKFSSILNEAKEIFNSSENLTLSSLGTITVDVQCDILQNNPLPEALTERLLKNMTFLKGLDVQYVDVGTDEERKLLGTPFFRGVQQYFQSKIEGKEPLKYVVFSAHDTTLQPFMAILNLTSWNCLLDEIDGKEIKGNCVPGYPIFASQIIIELHSEENKTLKNYYVKVIYNGVEMKLCESDETYCSFEEFNQRLDDYLLDNDDFEDACGSEINKEKQLFIQKILKK